MKTYEDVKILLTLHIGTAIRTEEQMAYLVLRPARPKLLKACVF